MTRARVNDFRFRRGHRDHHATDGRALDEADPGGGARAADDAAVLARLPRARRDDDAASDAAREDEGRCQRSVAPRAPASFASTTRVESRRGRSRRGDAQVARFLKRLLSRDEDDGADEEREGEEGAEEKPEEVVDATSAPAQATSATASSSSSLPKVDMKTTLSDLDALLGIDTEAEAAKKAAEEESSIHTGRTRPSTGRGRRVLGRAGER